MDLTKISTREKQAVGGICLLLFCDHYSIYDKSIAELAEHTLSVLISDNLPEWDKKGMVIALIGRGERLPKELIATIDKHIRDDFERLVGFITEIGMSDMYGADTANPTVYLDKTLAILKSHHITIILQNDMFIPEGDIGWGSIWNEARYALLINRYNEMLEKHYQ